MKPLEKPRRIDRRKFPRLCAIVVIAAATSTSTARVDPHAISADSPDNDVTQGALDDMDLFDMDVPVVVTASRHEEKVTALPYAISIITQDDIRTAGARSVADALRLVPGPAHDFLFQDSTLPR